MRTEVDRDGGQVLIMLAVMAVVLFGFVALAVDGGHLYGGRRRMQNAADAAAYAGAREICFGGHPDFGSAHAAAEAVALDYAIARNGADTATVQFLDDYTVDVVASQTLNTFFAGVIGISTASVRAEAAAMCSGSHSAGGVWPLAFNASEYHDTSKFPCGEPFLVFSRQGNQAPNLNCAPDFCYNTDGTEKDEDDLTPQQYAECSGKCNCAGIGSHWDSANRGWLRFPDPAENYPDDCKGNHNCGAAALTCYLEHDHPGPIGKYDCIPGKPGTNASVRKAIESRIGDIIRIILWDDEPCTIPSEGCPGEPYHVVDFGCIKPLQWVQQYDLSEWGDTKRCARFHALEAIKICDEEPHKSDYQESCATHTGTGSGEMPEEWEVRAVTLIK